MALASIAFAPEIVLPTLAYIREHFPATTHEHAFQRSFNPSFPGDSEAGWIAPQLCGLELGPMVIMIENYRGGLVWELMRRCPYIVRGLRLADFRGGWL